MWNPFEKKVNMIDRETLEASIAENYDSYETTSDGACMQPK